jgi:hypothetical protein
VKIIIFRLPAIDSNSIQVVQVLMTTTRRKTMKQPLLTNTLGYLLVALAGTVCSTCVYANAASDCRQEARDYGISEEQLDDYITGCLASRGELYAEETPDMESAAAAEEVVEVEELPEEPSMADGDVTY